jgi:hypothetical protein
MAVFSSPWNAKCQLLWNDEMQNDKIFMGVFIKCQIFHGVGESFLTFWPQVAKIQNGE